MKRNQILSFTAAVLAVSLLVALVAYLALSKSAPQPAPSELKHILLPEARELSSFSLMDMDGQPFGLDRLQGKWSFVFFGYTHCPDICPMTLSILKGTANRLQQADIGLRDTQFIFVSVDPGRDSPEHLKQYTAYFHEDFLGVTGDKKEIDNLSRQLGAMYMFDGDTTGKDYIVNHTAAIMLVDPQARWIGRFSPPHKAAGIAADYRRLRDHFPQN